MNNKQKAIYSIFVGIAVVIGIAIGQLLHFEKKTKLGFKPTQKDKIDNLLRYIKEEYVDSVKTDSIVDNVIRDIVQNLDPHSVYIPKQEVAETDEELEGEFTGIGVLFQKYRDTFTVIRPLDHSPAKAAGIQPMDRVLKIDNEKIFGENVDIEELAKKIKGKIGTKVKLTLYRKSKDSIFDLPVKRAEIPLVSVPAHFMINDTLGFIKISTFAANTYDEFHQAVKELKKQGMKALVLDLRNNTGGLLKQANLIADEFLPNGKLIFFTKDQKGKENKVIATSRGDFEDGQIYVLLNENSASASEIVAGALQDNDKAVIVGRRSFGKGLVQREMQLGDGSKVRLTTARYYTPTGRSIQKPYKNGHKQEYEQKFENRRYNGELYFKDSIPIIDSLKYTTPKGKIVYGGGGIIPDIFVPVNPNNMMEYGIFNYYLSDFITRYLDEHLEELTSYSATDFINNTKIENQLYEAFKKQHISDVYPQKAHSNPKNKAYLKKMMKALLARDLFGTNEFYKIWIHNDPMIQKILEQNSENTGNNAK